VLRRYLATQTTLHGATPGTAVPLLQELDRLHEELWAAARAGVTAEPRFAVVMLPPVNEIIDLHGSRLAAVRATCRSRSWRS